MSLQADAAMGGALETGTELLANEITHLNSACCDSHPFLLVLMNLQNSEFHVQLITPNQLPHMIGRALMTFVPADIKQLSIA